MLVFPFFLKRSKSRHPNAKSTYCTHGRKNPKPSSLPYLKETPRPLPGQDPSTPSPLSFYSIRPYGRKVAFTWLDIRRPHPSKGVSDYF